MLYNFFFITISFIASLNSIAMNPPQNDKSVRAYIGFPYITTIRSILEPTRALVEFENRHDAQRKRSLFDEFRREIMAQNDLFNNAFKHFNDILLLMPSSADPEIYLAGIIEEKIAAKQKNIDSLRYATVWRGSKPYSSREKAKLLAMRQQQIDNLQKELRSIQEWEMARRIFEQIECKDKMKKIFLESSSDVQTISQHKATTQPSATSPIPEDSSVEGMAIFLNWLDKEIHFKKMSSVLTSITYTSVPANGPKVTENFV